MAFVLAEEGAVKLLEKIKDAYAASDWLAMPYTNDVTPAYDDVLTDYTFAAYMDPIEDVGTLYSAPAGDMSGRGVMSIDELVWTQTEAASQTCYGYVIYDVNDVLILAERFASPVTLTVLGHQLKVTGHVFRAHS